MFTKDRLRFVFRVLIHTAHRGIEIDLRLTYSLSRRQYFVLNGYSDIIRIVVSVIKIKLSGSHIPSFVLQMLAYDIYGRCVLLFGVRKQTLSSVI